MSNSKALLSGIRVIDCGQFLPGPYAALMCADLGADVVKIEPPAGDPLRQYGVLEDGISLIYRMINRGKTIVTIDLKTVAGIKTFRQLVSQADVLIESYRPGAFEKLGLDNKSLSELNSRLVHASLTGYGGNGPYASRSGHDLNYLAAAGILSVSGLPDQPLIAMPPTADFASALQTAFTVSAALFSRERSGKGVHIDIAMSDVVLSWQAVALAEGPVSQDLRGLCTLNGGAAFYNIYKTKDNRFVTLAALEPKFWNNFCQAVNKPDWIKRQIERYPQTALRQELAELFATDDLHHWSALLAQVDCCFEPVCDLAELGIHPQIQFRKMLSAELSPDNMVEPLYPAWINGEPPVPRLPFKQAEVGTILETWGRSGFLGWS